MNKPFSAVTQVLRGYTYNQVKAVVEVLVDSPVHNVEVTISFSDTQLRYSYIKQLVMERVKNGCFNNSS